MILGVTATRRGLTLAQRKVFLHYLSERNVTELHHGDCLGGDATAHALFFRATQGKGRVVVHPPENKVLRAFAHEYPLYTFADCRVQPVKPYLDRNHDIVDACEVLVALPKGKTEELRSGTWATVRYARKVGKPITIIYPDGEIQEENQ